MSHKPNLKPIERCSRRDVTEGHWSWPETKLAVLLEQAFRIGEELALDLRSTQGSSQVQAVSQKLLENHVLTMTHILRHLSHDMKAVERHMTQCGLVTSAASVAVQSLDQKSLAAIADLRGRVARCDGCIAVLGADVSSGERQLNRLQQEVAELRSAVDVKLKEMKEKLHHSLGRQEASLLDCSQMSTVSDLQKQEDRMSVKLNEVMERTDSLRKGTHQELNSLARQFTQEQDKMTEALSKLSDQLNALEARMERFETQQDQADRRHADGLKHSEAKLSKRMTSVESSLHQELQLLKQEYHKGFLSVCDAIESLRQIGDTRSLLDKKKLQRDVKDICSKAVKPTDL